MLFVYLDQENGDLILCLPEKYQSFQDHLYNLLTEAFLNQEMNDETLAKMNQFVAAWLSRK